jgi:integrase
VAELEGGKRIVGRTDVSLRELCDEWEQWANTPGSNYSTRSAKLYPFLIKRHVFPVLGETTKAGAVTPADLRRLIDKLNAKGLAGASVHGVIVALSAVLRFGARRGFIDVNPVRGLERGDRPSAKRRKEPRYLDRSEIDRLLAKLGDEFRPVAATLAFAGPRVSESLALRWQDVDLTAGMLDVHGTKTASSTAPVPLIADLVTELRAHRSRVATVSLARVRPDALVFSTCNNRPHHRKNVLRAIYVAGDAAKLNAPGGKRVGCHDLRHSCAGLLLAAGVPAPRAAAVLRHADTRTLLTVYAGLVESQRANLRDDLELAFAGKA